MKSVLLAGGSGTRLWPLSRKQYPKQFLKLTDHLSLLQKSILRIAQLHTVTDLAIVTRAEYKHLVESQLRELSLDCLIVIEKEPKSTLAASLLGIKALQEERGLRDDESVLISSSDHFISPEEVFLNTVRTAGGWIEQNEGIVVFGITPHRPETGYGYIEIGDHLDGSIHQIKQFVEKPCLEKAFTFLQAGTYFWNAGIFLLTPQTFWKELHTVGSSFASLESLTSQELLACYAQLAAVPIDCELMEKTKRGYVSLLPVAWSDIGSWDSLHEMLGKDTDENATVGNSMLVNTKNCLVLGNKRLISTIGLENLLIIDSEDALFIAKKGESQQVKHLVETLLKKGAKEVIEPTTSHRPWGSYTILEEGSRYKIKKITVNPGGKLSLQMHFHRSEHWVIVQGTAKVTIGNEERTLRENESVFVEKTAVHRLENPGKIPLEMIEVQVGEYLGEDDIVRLEDIYARL